MLLLTEVEAPIDGRYDHLDHITDMHRMVEVFQRHGWEIFFLPKEFACQGRLGEIFSEIVPRQEKTLALWCGFVPSFSHYEAVYQHLAQKNLYLPNPPEAHQEIMELDRSLRCLRELTPESRLLESLEQAEEVVAQLGLPLFLKGAVFSLKEEGWESCVASTLEEVKAKYRAFPQRLSRGRVIARKFLPLRKNGEILAGFPIAREFRFLLWRGEILAYGFYWPFGDDAFIALSEDEQKAVFPLVQEAAGRFRAPYVMIDIGQTEDGAWWVIESGDPQFAGISTIEMEPMVAKITERWGAETRS
jgi:hypothetical protein